MISLLDQTVDSKLLERCSLTDQQLSNNSLVPAEEPNRYSPIEDSCLATASNNPASQCQDVLNDILSYNDLEKEYTSDDWDKYFAAQLPSPPLDNVSEIEMDVLECHSTANIGLDPSVNVLEEESETAADNRSQRTGLEDSNVLQMEIHNVSNNFVGETLQTDLESPDLQLNPLGSLLINKSNRKVFAESANKVNSCNDHNADVQAPELQVITQRPELRDKIQKLF